MTEVVTAFINYAFNELAFIRIQAVHSINNPSSGRVMEKSGMVLEGLLHKYISYKGNPPDDGKIYAIVIDV